jgi:hypothetical protein
MKETITLLLLILLSLPLNVFAQTKQIPHLIVFTHVTVVDVAARDSKSALKSDQTIIIAGNLITAVGKTGKVRIPPDAQVFDATGKFLIPGLWDMHTHSREDAFARRFIFPLDIANGVTGVRDMAGDCLKNCQPPTATTVDLIRQWRADITAGTLVGPRIFAASSPLIDGAPPAFPGAYVVKNAEEARQAVGFFKARGVDFLKVYSYLSRDAYFALADEAKRQGVVFAGHVPVAVSVAEASDAGQKSLEHMHGMQEGCSTRETELRNEQLQTLDRQVKGGERPHVYPLYIAQAQRAFDSYSGAKCGALFARFVKNGTWIVPTLVDKALMSRQANNPASLLTDPRNKYVPRSIRFASSGAINANDATAKRLRIVRYTRMVGEMERAGVGLLAGTDLASRSPGFSVHDELSLFVEGGLTPLQALQTATINPARYFGSDQFGTVERGKLADLILLDANPLDDIRNTQRIRAVVANGRYFSRTELDTILSEVEAFADKK